MTELIITNLGTKTKRLKSASQQKHLHSYKFMDEQELIKHLYFSYDKRAVYYLMKKYHMKVANAMMYLENLYYIDDEVKHPKVSFLETLKQELQDENLLIEDPLFPYFLKNKVVIYDHYLDATLTPKVLTDLKKITEVKVHSLESSENRKPTIFKFRTISEELHFVASRICNLSEQGIPFSKIKLVNVHSEYEYDLKRIFKFFHIPVTLPSNEMMLSTQIASTFLKLLGTIPNGEVIDELKEQYKTNEAQVVIQKIVSILNEYSWCDEIDSDIYEMVYYDLAHTKKPASIMKTSVLCASLLDIEDDDYVFFVGFNADTVPKTKKDEDYLNDTLKEQLGLLTVSSFNKQLRRLTKEKILHGKHMTITYKELGKTKEAYPSSLLEEIDGKTDTFFETESYSRLEEQLLLASSFDEYRKYGAVTENLKKYHSLYPDFAYQNYQNDYQKIDASQVLDYLKEKGEMVLSYSNLDHYMKCRFRYYLDNILNLNIYQENFSAIIGSYYHEMLEKKDNPDFDFEKMSEDFLKNYQFSSKETFLLKRLQVELKDVLKITTELENLSQFQEKFYEEKIAIAKDREIPITIKGFIDKIMAYHHGNDTYISLIDYKTGGYDANLSHIYYGLGLQLPIYAYLISKSPKWKNYQLAGFYIAPILVSEDLQKKKDAGSLETQKKEKMKLIGYSLDDLEILKTWDSTYENSMMIKSMKITSKGFGPYAKVLSKEQLNHLVTFIDSLIDKAITDILDANFEINPKLLNGKNMSCEYCPYEEICYKKYEDFENLEPVSYQTFLGGEAWEEVGPKNS